VMTDAVSREVATQFVIHALVAPGGRTH